MNRGNETETSMELQNLVNQALQDAYVLSLNICKPRA